MNAIPIRRTGFRRWWPATREELKRACAFAELEARRMNVWHSPEGLCRFIVWTIGEQLGHRISAVIEGTIGPNDQPVISIHMGEFVHFIDVRDVVIDEPMELTNRVTDTLHRSFSHKPGQPPSPGIAAAVAEVKKAMEAPAKTKQTARRR